MAHMLKKTDIMQSNKTKTEHAIQFLFHFADTGKKKFHPTFFRKVQQLHLNTNLFSAEVRF